MYLDMHVHKYINKDIHMLVCVTLKTVNDCHGWGYLVHHQISQNIIIIISIKMNVYDNQFHVHFVDLLADNYFTY